MTALRRLVAAIVARIRGAHEAASAAAIDDAVRRGASDPLTQATAYTAVMHHSAGPH